MTLRSFALFSAGMACAAVAGMAGQTLVAGAQAPAPSVKTLYAQKNVAFEASMAVAGSPGTVMKITVQAPAAGTAEIQLDSQLWADFPATTTNVLGTQVYVARCTKANTVDAEFCKGGMNFYLHKPQDQGSTDSTHPYSMTALLRFSQAGTKSIFLNVSSNAYPGGLYAETYAHLQAAFTPNRPIAAGSAVTISGVTAS